MMLGLLAVSCGDNGNDNSPEADHSADMTTKTHMVKVEEKVDAGSYSYLRVSENDNSYWIAVPKADLKKGDVIKFSHYMEMKNFRSETLDRTFESVLFVDDARSGDETPVNNPHQTELGSIPKENVSMKKADGGFTVAELFAKKDELSGKTVKVRGKVVKANLGILNRNWFHIQDGTGDQGTHDLTITSSGNAGVGDVITAKGKLVKDKDFGSGYTYSLILEDAEIAVDK